MRFCLLVIVSFINLLGSLLPVELECDWSVQRSSCPPFGTTDWVCLEAKQKCQSGKEYHCLKDEDGKWIETCAESKTCLKGQEPIYSRTDGIKCQPCSNPELYEPVERIPSSIYSECRRKKRKCPEDVSMECHNIAKKHVEDRECKCDHTNDYIPQNYDFDSEYWICKKAEKLICVQEPCPEDATGRKERRGTDYRCTSNAISHTAAPTTRTSTTIPVEITTPVHVSTKEPSDDVFPVGKVVLSFLCCIVVVVVPLYLGWQLRRSRFSGCQLRRSRLSGTPGVPSGPIQVITIDYTIIAIEFQPPNNDGGYPLICYVVYIVEKGSKTEVKTLAPNKSKCIIEDLHDDTEYLFCVTAKNVKGESAPLQMENAVKTKKITVPGIPEGYLVFSHITASSLKLAWEPPSDNGGAPILNYLIKYRNISSRNWTKGVTVSNVTTSWTQNDLKKGSEYIFQVFAVNKEGNSEPLESKIKVSYRPGIALNTKVYPISTTESCLTWDPPEDDGGSDIKQYIIRRSTNRVDWQEIGFLKPKTVTARIDCKVQFPDQDESFYFGVCAENENGRGEFNDAPKPLGPPEEPQCLQFSDVKQKSFKLVWKPPEYDGGTPLTNYRVKRNSNMEIGDLNPKTTEYHVQNLQEGTQYDFYVIAQNRLGSSKPAQIKVVTESATVPKRPTGPVKFSEKTNTSVNLSWKQPCYDGGLPVTSFCIIYGDVDSNVDWKTETLPGDEINWTCEELIYGPRYQFKIFAINAKGKSEALVSDILLTKTETPGEPVNLKVLDTGYTELTLTWGPPESDGNIPLTEYLLEERKFKIWRTIRQMNPETTTITLNGLNPGTKYLYRITAVNVFGKGTPLEITVATNSLKRPEPPAGLLWCRTVKDDSVSFSWKPPNDDGGRPILGYYIEIFDSVWKEVGFVTVSKPSWTQPKLLISEEYSFRITAKNKVGISDPLQFPAMCKSSRPLTEELKNGATNESASFEPEEDKKDMTATIPAKKVKATPSPPENFTVKVKDASTVKLSWKKCKYDGDSKCSGFIIKKRNPDDEWVEITTLSPKVFEYTVKDLCCHEITFSVAAVNAAGPGEAAQKLIILKRVPGPPTGPLLTKDIDANGLTLSWSHPTTDGGCPLIGYVIEKLFTNKWIEIGTSEANKTEYRVGNLISETPYGFRVKTQNSIGFSDYLQLENGVVTGNCRDAENNVEVTKSKSTNV